MIVERGSRHIGFWDEKEGAIGFRMRGKARSRVGMREGAIAVLG